MTFACDDVLLMAGGNAYARCDEFSNWVAQKSPGSNFYVNKGSGLAASGDGSCWDYPFLTIAEAITAANALIDWAASPWAPNAKIHIAPGKYAENLTSLPYGCEMIGYGDAWDADGERGVQIHPATGGAVACTSIINSKFKNIGFQVTDASHIINCTNLNNVQFLHCYIAGPPEATTALSGITTKDTVCLTIRDTRFYYMDCGIDVISGAGPTFVRALIDRNFFSFISEAGIRLHSTTVAAASLIIENYICHGANSNTLATGIDINITTPDVGIYRNTISATDPISGDDLGAYVGGNYCNGVLE